MDERRIDRIARGEAAAAPRRRVLAGLAGGALAALGLGRAASADRGATKEPGAAKKPGAAAKHECHKRCNETTQPGRARGQCHRGCAQLGK